MRNLSKLMSVFLAVMMIMTLGITTAFASDDGSAGGSDESSVDINGFLKEHVTAASESGIVSTDTWIMRNFTTKAPSDDAKGYDVGNTTIYLKKNITEDELVHHITSYSNNAKLTDNMNSISCLP